MAGSNNTLLFKIKTLFSGNNVFATMSQQINGATQGAQRLNKTFDVQKRSIGDLKAKIEQWSKASDKSYRTDHIKKYATLINSTKKKIEELETATKSCNEKSESMFKSVFNAQLLMKGLGMAKNAVMNFAKESTEAYQQHNVAKTQLSAVMRNTMNASEGDVKDVVDFTGEEAKKGVISKSVQLGGAKELATYVTEKDSLKSLIPVLNDAIAHQYGLNASQESAASMASMFGKVLDGQTGALARNGYRFDEAQEKILKTGTEYERVAVLAEVVSQSVGGVNAALAATPEGKAKQTAIEYEEVQLRVGELMTTLKGDATVTMRKFAITLYENRQGIATVAKILGTATVATTAYIAIVKSGITAVKLKTAAMAAKGFVTNLLTGKIKIATLAQAAFNTVMKMNPIGAVIGLITAAATAFMLFKKRGTEATDVLKKTGEYAQDYYSKEKSYLDEMFSKMEKYNGKSKERNALVDELKQHYPGLNAELERELRTTNDLSKAKETLIGLVKKQAIAEGMKEILKEKAEKVARAELTLASFEMDGHKPITTEEYEKAMKYGTESEREDAKRRHMRNGMDSVAQANYDKVKAEYDRLAEHLKNNEAYMSGLLGTGGVSGNGDSGKGASSTASDTITGGGKSMKNITINVESLLSIGTNNNHFTSGEGPSEADDFMDKLRIALMMVLNDVNYG
jgi:hypothetical protein